MMLSLLMHWGDFYLYALAYFNHIYLHVKFNEHLILLQLTDHGRNNNNNNNNSLNTGSITLSYKIKIVLSCDVTVEELTERTLFIHKHACCYIFAIFENIW